MSAAENEPEGGEVLVEDATDRASTRMAYHPKGHMPWLLTGIWIVALLSLIAYYAIYAIPDVGLWGSP